MKRIFLLLLIIVTGCIKHDINPISDPCTAILNDTFESCSTVQAVTADKCIIKEAVIADQNGIVTDRYVYHHNGTNYDKIDRFYNEYNTSPYSPNPTETLGLTYKDGRIYQVRFGTSILDKTGVMWTTMVWTFSYLDAKLVMHYDLLNRDGTVNFSYDNYEFNCLAPKDSIYFCDGFVDSGFDERCLLHYKGSNFIREGIPSAKGFCTLHDANWLFVKNYYDDLPNVLTDYAVRYPITTGKGLYGYMADSYVPINTNNITAQTYNDGTTDDKRQYCWTFLKNSQNYWLKKFTVVTGATITYQYDCE